MKNLKNGFTLIELLVVVLIIGILASISLPQYYKVMERSKAGKGLIILREVDKAFRTYHSAHRTYPKSFNDIEYTLPSEFDTDENFVPNGVTYGKTGDEWNISFERYKNNSVLLLYMMRTTGKYKGAGFVVTYVPSVNIPAKKILCYERKSVGRYLFNSKLGAGAYCEKLMGYKNLLDESVYARVYDM